MELLCNVADRARFEPGAAGVSGAAAALGDIPQRG